MKFAAVIAALATVAAAHYDNVTYVTETVTALTTYCPGPTKIVHNGNTITVTEATTLTITDCPCTIVKPVYTTSKVHCHDCAKPSGKWNETKTYPTGAPAYSKPPKVTAGAGKAATVAGAGLAAIIGLAAFAL
jgi:hypothetical protein